jgi:hypothetical protein
MGAASSFPIRWKEAQVSCTPEGRSLIGWIVANRERESWDIWRDVCTGSR